MKPIIPEKRQRPSCSVPTEIAADIKSFLTRLKLKNSTPNTIKVYGYVLNLLGRFLGFSERHRTCDVSIDDILGFLEQEATHIPRLAPATLRLYHTAVVKFIEFLAKQHKCPITIEDLETLKEVRPKSRRRLPTVDWKGLLKLIYEISDTTQPPTNYTRQQLLVWYRRRAIYVTLFSTGMRVSALCNMNRSDIRTEIIIRTKNDADHYVYMSDTAQKFCHDYLALRTDTCDAMFVAHDEGRAVARIRPVTVQRLLRHDREYYGIPGITPHKVRHLAAKQLLDATHDIELVRQFLGHESIVTTQIYAKMDNNQVQAEIGIHHPAFRRERMKKEKIPRVD